MGQFLRDNNVLLGLSYIPYVQQYIASAMVFRRLVYHIGHIANKKY
jgi:hypothetical protein